MDSLQLRESARDDAIVVLAGTLPASATAVTVRYAAPLGALARVDGGVAGAFDREHRELAVEPSTRARTLSLEVERRGLPTNGLPAGPGLRWRLMNRRAAREPQRTAALEPRTGREAAVPEPADPLPLWGHSHLDVAWLWTYAAAGRKAMRTFANAVALLDAEPAFAFAQSQPQLYAFVREADPAFFERVAARVRAGRFDAGVAALWVEPDCNLPSGESLLRQLAFARRFCSEAFGVEPAIAWLPDTFGFARTLPSLLAHAGVRYFATTKLQWNDTTRFAYPQFRWRGPDGAEVVAASLSGMDGGCSPARVAAARERAEPLIVGYGDGGGGPTAEQLRAARTVGRFEAPGAFFARLETRRAELPLHDDELYLEYHRGVYTTHHDVKAANASLERRLADAEERAAWCVALRAPAAATARLRALLRDAWEIVLRAQFHDVLTGTSIAEVYDDVRAEYARAGALADAAVASAAAMLPRAARPPGAPRACGPRERDGVFEFDNGSVRARVTSGGEIVELTAGAIPSTIERGNRLALYRDRPAKWEAWNVDADYAMFPQPLRVREARIDDGALAIPFDAGAGSHGTLRIRLGEGEPFLRVSAAIDWRARRRFLRVENELRIDAAEVTYGAPHGVVVRSALADTPARRAQYEVPGQRFAAAWDRGTGYGTALFALDTYGWSGRAAEPGRLRLGHSLLRATTWPDPLADAGEHRLEWAYAPLRASDGIGRLERVWQRFAGSETPVRLFETGDEGVSIAACKPAEDGDGVVLRLRECDGIARRLRVRCGGRMRAASAVDGLERPLDADVAIDGESIVASIGAFGLRSFRVRF